MSTAEFAQTGAGAETLPAAPDARGSRIVRRLALGAYAFVFVFWTLRYGIPIQRELVIAWICGALACASIGRSPREIVQLVADWLPMAVFLLAYDFTRGPADSLGIAPHFTTMIDFDRFVFFGQTPTEWLQERIYRPGGGALVGRLLHVPLHLALHRPLRPRRRPLGAQPQRLPAVHPPLRHPQRRRARDLHPLPCGPAVDGLRAGPPRADHRSTGRGWEVIDVHTAAAFNKGQCDRQPGRRRALAARRVLDARRALPLAAGQLVVAAAARPLPAGDGPDADRDRRALLLRRRARLALRGGGDGGLGLVGAPPAAAEELRVARARP